MSQKEINELLAKLNQDTTPNNDNSNNDSIPNPNSIKKQVIIRSVSDLNRSASAFPARYTPSHRSFNTHLKAGQYKKRNGSNANIFSRSKTAVMFNYSSRRTHSVFGPIKKNGSHQNLLFEDALIENDGIFYQIFENLFLATRRIIKNLF